MAAFDRSRLLARVRTWACGPGALHVHATLFAVAAVALTLLNLAVDAERIWFWRPLLIWAVVLAAHALAVAYRCGLRVPSATAATSDSRRSPSPVPSALTRRLARTVDAVREATRLTAAPSTGQRGMALPSPSDWGWSQPPLAANGHAQSAPRPFTPTNGSAPRSTPDATRPPNGDAVLPAARFAKVAAALRQAAQATSVAAFQADRNGNGNGGGGSAPAAAFPAGGAGNGAADGAAASPNGATPAWAAAWPTVPVSHGANGANGHAGAKQADDRDHAPDPEALPETILALWQPRGGNGATPTSVRPIVDPPASAMPEVPEVGGRRDGWGEPALAAFAPSHPDSPGGTTSGPEFTWA